MPVASALDGLKVVDYSANLVGAHAGQVLADNGAEVIMVEPPGGSALRDAPGAPFLLRGRKSIELDLKDPVDRMTAHDLSVAADVMIEAWRPGVAERLGLGFDGLHAENPRLVYGSVTGFGRTGPLARIKAYEGVVMAKLGAFGSLQLADRPPPSFGTVPTASFSVAQTLLHGVLAALIERETSGAGQRVDTSMLLAMTAHDCWTWLARTIAARYPDAFSAPPRVDDERKVPNGVLPFRFLVGLTKDGRWLQFSQNSTRLWAAFLGELGLAWMLDDPQWRDAPTNPDVDLRDELWTRMLEAVRRRTLAEWWEVFERQPNVFAEEYRRGTELLTHPQLLHEGRVIEVHDRKLGLVRQLGELVGMNGTPARAALRAPGLDEHGAELRGRPSATADRRADATSAASGASPALPGPPLTGVTILELGSFYAGPYGATLLCELGARVIKIEPLEGDPIRSLLPFPETTGVKVLSGKESVAVDVATAEGRDIVYDLVARADAVLRTFRGGVAERLGLDARTLLALNPRLAYLNAPGYGVDGPYGSRPTYAPAIAAGTGVACRNLGATKGEDVEMAMPELKRRALLLSAATIGQTNSDAIAALSVATGLLLGLLARRRGATGQSMLTTMLNSNGHLLGDELVEYEGRPASREVDADILGLDPLYRLYPTADGWVFLAVTNTREWHNLVAALGDHGEVLAADERLGTPDARQRNGELLAAMLTDVLARRSAAQWEEHLVARDVACVEVADGPTVVTMMEGDGALARQLDHLVELEHPVCGPYVRLKPLVEFSRSTGRTGGAPLVGAHTTAVLRELGYDDSTIADLRASGVVGG